MLFCVSVAKAEAQYPAKTIRFVAPYPAGGSNDEASRITAQAASYARREHTA